jgi:hypothetical protein
MEEDWTEVAQTDRGVVPFNSVTREFRAYFQLVCGTASCDIQGSYFIRQVMFVTS